MVGEPARLQRPDAVVHAGAVQKDRERSVCVVGAAAGSDEHLPPVEINPHGVPFGRAESV